MAGRLLSTGVSAGKKWPVLPVSAIASVDGVGGPKLELLKLAKLLVGFNDFLMRLFLVVVVVGFPPCQVALLLVGRPPIMIMRLPPIILVAVASSLWCSPFLLHVMLV